MTNRFLKYGFTSTENVGESLRTLKVDSPFKGYICNVRCVETTEKVIENYIKYSNEQIELRYRWNCNYTFDGNSLRIIFISVEYKDKSIRHFYFPVDGIYDGIEVIEMLQVLDDI